MMRLFFPSTIRAAGGFEPEYIAVLDRAIALGYTTPDEPTNIRNNNRVKYLKDTGLWAKFDLLYFFDQPTGLADFAKLNYIDPLLYEAFNANPALEPDFIADSGFKSGGTKFFDTGFNVQTNGVNFIGGAVDIGRASVFYRGFDFAADATNETICGALLTGGSVNQINILKLSNNTQSLFRLASTQGGQAFTG